MSNNQYVEGILTHILNKRGISKKEQARFLRPNFYEDQHDASTMLDMDVAIKRLKQLVKKKEKLVIFGDYDADGVPATALLLRGFQRLGVRAIPLIPNRSEGYGLTAVTVERIISLHPDLVVTVDNGTVAKPEIAALKKAGIPVIVVDHHEPQKGELASAALAVINPKQQKCPYPFKELCACGLAWKLLNQLYKELGEDTDALKWDLDLVALSTIADMVPLIGENRVLVKFGMLVLQKSRNVGVQALAQMAGVQLRTISPSDVSFRLAPRINAPSRMHQELVEGNNAALTLLTTENPEEAYALAQFLNQHNSERQRLVESHIEQAELQVSERSGDLVLVVHHESWSTGVIGLVASKLMDKYRRPVIALAKEGDSIKGSVRTVDGVHALNLLTASQDLLEKFGGHARAAGLTLKAEVSVFRVTVNEWLKSQGGSVESMAATSSRTVDAELELTDISLELVDALATLEPFGVAFPDPLFSTTATVSAVRLVGNAKQHFSCFLTNGKRKIKAIAFGKAHLAPQEGELCEVQYTLGADSWRDVRTPVCYIQNLVIKR